jgi:hypothetical protein
MARAWQRVDPRQSSLNLKAKGILVVRNNLLDQAHHDGPLHGGIVPATQYAAGPLSTGWPPAAVNRSTCPVRIRSPG